MIVERPISLLLTFAGAFAFALAASMLPLTFSICLLGPVFSGWSASRIVNWERRTSRRDAVCAWTTIAAVCLFSIARPKHPELERIPNRLVAPVLTIEQLGSALGALPRSKEPPGLFAKHVQLSSDRPTFDEVDRALRTQGACLRYLRCGTDASLWSGAELYAVTIEPLTDRSPQLRERRTSDVVW